VFSALTGLLVGFSVVLAATAFGLVRRSRDGRLRPADSPHREVLTALGVEPGTPVTLLQFSSAFCAPCRATRRILTDVADLVEGVSHVEIDAESHLDLVRRLNVMRTPTVFILNADGTIVRRGSGLPRKADIVAALGETVP
jgi:thiol-disulfide isomerase/thioredoxin